MVWNRDETRDSGEQQCNIIYSSFCTASFLFTSVTWIENMEVGSIDCVIFDTIEDSRNDIERIPDFLYEFRIE